MARVQAISATYLDRRRGRRRSAEAEAQLTQFRQAISGLRTPDEAFLIALDESDKPATVRLRLLRAASDEGKEIVVRRHPDGFVIGLMTDNRRRKPRNPCSARRRLNPGNAVSIRVLDEIEAS